MEFNHKPVMLEECLEALNIKKNNIYVDGTLGGARTFISYTKKIK